MRSFLLLAYCLLTLSQIGIAQTTPQQIQRIDSALTALHRQAMFNGVVIIAKDGKTLYQKTFGGTDYPEKTPLTLHSSFNLASISKQFTSMMVMQLKEKGKLRFDDPVQQYLPEFPYPAVTIRHLLTHTSGLPEYFNLAFQYYNTLDTLDNGKVLKVLHDRQPALTFQPGEKWGYCNTNYVVLSAVIERTAGMPMEDFFRQQITVPLGLSDTYVYTLRMKQSPANRVHGVQRAHGKYEPNDLMRFDGVAGDKNFYASAADLLKWDQALYTRKLVSAETWKEATSPVRLNDGTTHPYGFGWFIRDNGSVLSHTGTWVGFSNLFERNIAQKTTLIVLSNSTDATYRAVMQDVKAGKTPRIPSTQLIQNVQLIDGTGLPARREDVRLRDDKIWETGALSAFPGEQVVDGKGLTLAPGFIDSHSHHFGGLSDVPEAIPTVNQGITTIVIGQDGSSYDMDTLAVRMQARPVAVNVATYTGQSTLRSAVMGEKDLFRTATPAEVSQMKTLLEKEMEKGSLGLSTGLEYESAFFSNRNEVIELAKTAAQYKGRYISHVRSEDINLDEAIEEIIDIGRVTHIPVQVSHIKIAKRDNWGKAPELLARLQQAREEGIDITADCYPYDFWNSTLRVLFPNRDYTNPASAEFAVQQLFDPSKSVLVRFAPEKSYVGKTVSEVAAMRKETPAQTLMNLVAIAAEFEEKHPDYSDGVETIMGKSMDEADVASFLTWPYTNICSDGSSGGHPRGHGSFTRVLGRYVREQKIMPLETAVFKMTGLAAEHLGITDRGTIVPGNYADLVLFNPETVIDNANIGNAKALSTGIERVWINGSTVYKNQQPTGQYPGVLIRRK